jgi:nucleoside-diphosphate-sugar epimerase
MRSARRGGHEQRDGTADPYPAAVRLLVTGATGFVGRAVVRAALDGGHLVRALVRDASRAAAIFGEWPVEVVTGDVRSSADVRQALGDVDAMVHAAATFSYRRGDAALMLRNNTAIAEAVLAAAAEAGTGHVLDISSVIVFRAHLAGPLAGTTDGNASPWDASARQWLDPYLRSKVEAYLVARRFSAAGLPVSSIHPANVIGPGDRRPGPSGGALFDLLVSPMNSKAKGNWVDVRDLATGIVNLAGRPPGGAYLFSGGYVPFREMATLIDGLTGRRPRRLWFSVGMTRLSAGLNDVFGGRIMQALPPRGSLEYILTVGPVDGSSGAQVLGRPYRPMAETVSDALRWWADEGMLPRRLIGRLAA